VSTIIQPYAQAIKRASAIFCSSLVRICSTSGSFPFLNVVAALRKKKNKTLGPPPPSAFNSTYNKPPCVTMSSTLHVTSLSPSPSRTCSAAYLSTFLAQYPRTNYLSPFVRFIYRQRMETQVPGNNTLLRFIHWTARAASALSLFLRHYLSGRRLSRPTRNG